MKRLLLTLLACCCLSLAHAQQAPLRFVQPYGGLLADNLLPITIHGIKTTGVDYARWQLDQRHGAAMHLLKMADPTLLKTREERLAFWLNAYNLLIIDLVLKTREQDNIRNQGSVLRNVWRKHIWPINHTPYTLHQIEHEILRPLAEPRIHFALNCASLSCPDLRNEPYSSQPLELNAQLDEQTRTFLNNPTKGAQLMPAGGLRVSPIFNWFKEDFGEDPAAFIAAYRPDSGETNAIDGFFDYDWRLNAIPGRAPQ